MIANLLQVFMESFWSSCALIVVLSYSVLIDFNSVLGRYFVLKSISYSMISNFL